MNDMLEGPNKRDYALLWLASQPLREQIAKRVSPLTYVRLGLPPILIVHGDSDPVVPYSQSVRLHEALDHAGVPNELISIPGGKHGRFARDQTLMAYTRVWAFLAKYLPPAR